MEEVTGLTEPWDLLSFAAPPSSAWWEWSKLSLPWFVMPAKTLLCFILNLLLQFLLNIKQEGETGFSVNNSPAKNICSKKETPTSKGLLLGASPVGLAVLWTPPPKPGTLLWLVLFLHQC